MLIPAIVLYAVVCVILLVLGIIKSNRNILAAINLLFWLASAASAIAISWVWRDRGMGENWAIMGVVFFSFPIILVTFILAIATIIAIRVKKVARMGFQQVSLCLLLLFLILQVVFGVMSGVAKS